MSDDCFQSPPQDELIKKYLKTKRSNGNLLELRGVGHFDVYNGCPFRNNGNDSIIARVEHPWQERYSSSRIFHREGDKYFWDKVAPVFNNLQDPLLEIINDEYVLRGVETYSDPTPKEPNRFGYNTVFFRGHNIGELEKFAGIPGMKDITPVEMNDGIGVFTRPETLIEENGKDEYVKEVGFTKIKSLDGLTEKAIKKAKIIMRFAKDEWGGVNRGYFLNGKILALGHSGKNTGEETNERKHYSATLYNFDPETYEVSDLRIIATRDDFPYKPSKQVPGKNSKFLEDIVFPGGLKRNGGKNTAVLYAGISDNRMGEIPIQYPF